MAGGGLTAAVEWWWSISGVVRTQGTAQLGLRRPEVAWPPQRRAWPASTMTALAYDWQWQQRGDAAVASQHVRSCAHRFRAFARSAAACSGLAMHGHWWRPAASDGGHGAVSYGSPEARHRQ